MSWLGDEVAHGQRVGRVGVEPVLDRPGEARWRLHVERGRGEQVAGDPLGVRHGHVVEVALDGGQRGVERGERGVERGQVPGEDGRVVRRGLGQRALDGGGDRGHPRQVVPEVGVGVGSGDVEHGRGVHQARVSRRRRRGAIASRGRSWRRSR